MIEIVSILSVISFFYILSIVLKDVRFRKKNLLARNRSLSLSLIFIFIANMGYLLLPEEHETFTFIQTFSTFFISVVFINYYRKNYHRIPINFSNGSDFLAISSDKYMTLAPNIMGKLYKKGETLLSPGDEKFIEVLKNYELDKYVVIFVKASMGAEFPWHKHPTMEILIAVEGEAEVHPDMPIVNKKRVIKMPKEKEHYFQVLSEYFEGVALIRK